MDYKLLGVGIPSRYSEYITMVTFSSRHMWGVLVAQQLEHCIANLQVVVSNAVHIFLFAGCVHAEICPSATHSRYDQP